MLPSGEILFLAYISVPATCESSEEILFFLSSCHRAAGFSYYTQEGATRDLRLRFPHRKQMM